MSNLTKFPEFECLDAFLEDMHPVKVMILSNEFILAQMNNVRESGMTENEMAFLYGIANVVEEYCLAKAELMKGGKGY